LKQDCADEFQRQCYQLLAAWVGDYPEQVLVAPVIYGSCPMCDIPNSVPMGHSTFQPHNDPRNQHIYLELVENNNVDTLVHPFRNHFWQYSPCNVYRLWQPDELHPLH